MRVRKRLIKVALPPGEVRGIQPSLHIASRVYPVREDPCRGSHMLRQTRKGGPERVGTKPREGHEGDVVVLFVGWWRCVEGCMDCSLVWCT